MSASDVRDRPEVGKSVQANGLRTNYLEAGSGDDVVVFVHGSGPGVTAYANWNRNLPAIAEKFHCYAPDMVGFGYSERPEGVDYSVQTWADQVIGFLDAIGLAKVSLVGNSFGGAIALRAATQHPDRFDKLVLMGAMGVSFPITKGLDWAWGYEPSFENMRGMLDLFAYSRELVTDELAEVRYQASIQPGFQESFGSMFPAPRQRSVDAMAIPEDELKALPHETLIVHGREDQVIPLENSYRLLQLLKNSQLHVFGRCGHWSQIEWADEFSALLLQFFSAPPHKVA